MIFRSIKLVNYGVYAGEQVINPAAGLPRNITLIGGFNGRGKTSLLDAVLLALYGNQSPSARGLAYSTYLESLVHKGVNPEEGSMVELELELPSGTEQTQLRIRRSWRLSSKRFTDRLEVWRAGVLDPQMAANWTTHVEDLVPSGLAGLFFFDGEKIAELAEADEVGESLRQAIRSMLGLDLVDRLIADMGTVVRRNQAKLKNQAAREAYEQLQSRMDELELKRQNRALDLARLKAELDRSEALREEKELSLQDEGRRQDEGREEAKTRERELALALQDYKSEAVQMAAGPMPLLLVGPLLQQIRVAAHQDESNRQAQSALQVLVERDQKLVGHLRRVAGSEQVLSEVQNWLDADRANLLSLSERPPVLGLSPGAVQQVSYLVDVLGDQLLEQSSAVIQGAEQTAQELLHVKDHLIMDENQERVQAMLREIAEATRHTASIKHKRELAEKELLQVQQEIEAVRRAMADYAEERLESVEAEKITAYAKKTVETMRALGERATQKKVGELTTHIADAFDTLTHKTSLVSEIRMEPATLRISLHDSEGREVPKYRLSSGEKQMLAIAILWGLARASGRRIPVIIDTPMGRLDSSHRMNFVTKYLPNASHQVLVLSTDTEIVGPYLESLNGSIGKSYLLEYDDVHQRTEVVTGYFRIGSSVQ